ncbi:MAG TPA: diguanylate cyclase, partial [Verrucomicrobiae bacterium]|nr:diguanylate cyclase [Verrucomicrobiae bacterium]
MKLGALERAHLVRSIAELLSNDEPTTIVLTRCCPPLAALAEAGGVTIAVRAGEGDRVACVYGSGNGAVRAHAPVHPGSLEADVLSSGETTVRSDGRQLSIGVPISFGHALFGAICFREITAYDAEHVTLLESCALYIGARLYHESAVAQSERFEKLALTDALTGIPNRRSFDESLAQEWARELRDGSPIALSMIDLDYFKSYNDTYGHQAGDQCLQRVARALFEEAKRPGDVMARYGGEEFVCLLPLTPAAGAIALAEELRAAVRRLQIPHAGSTLGIMTISLGVASTIPAANDSSASLLRAADDALYRAKLGGRNRVYAAGYESEAPAARPRRSTARSGLPIALTRLVGRRNEISQTRALLAHHRLVSIVGTGGTGKTRTAIAAAAEVSDRFADGVWFVDLSPLNDPSLIVSTIASSLGMTVPIGEDAVSALATLLSERSLLIVVDNCEHLVAGVATTLRSLLAGAPKLSLLVTSREPLGISGEAVYRLPLLSLPPPHSEPNATEAMAYDAIALFVERATEARREFALTEANVGTVVEICRNVDGIALAIELTASRVAAIGLQPLAARLRDFRLPGGGDRTAAPRQQTMHATMGWSYELLSESERTLFRRLAIFAGGFTYDAATAVGLLGEVHRDEIFELLTSLIRKSLVADDALADGRYRLLEPVRAFARERLLDAGELHAAARRHAEYFEELARRSDTNFYTTPARAWLHMLEPEADNFRAALEWALDDRGDVVLGASIAAATQQFFNDYRPGEGARWTQRALETLPRGAAPATEARLCAGLAVRLRSSPASVLRAAAERAVDLYRALGDQAGLVEALRGLAQTLGWYFREERELADALACEAIALARELGEPTLLALALRTRGLTIDIRDFPQKRAVLEEALALIRQHGNERSIAGTLTWISDLEFSAGDEARALE